MLILFTTVQINRRPMDIRDPGLTQRRPTRQGESIGQDMRPGGQGGPQTRGQFRHSRGTKETDAEIRRVQIRSQCVGEPDLQIGGPEQGPAQPADRPRQW